MTERHDPHPADAVAGDRGKPEQATADVPAHIDAGPEAHGAPEDHTDGGEPLGPLDVPAWSAAVLGVALGLVIVLAFVMAAT